MDLWDYVQHLQIRELRTDVDGATSGIQQVTESLQHDHRNLAERIDRLTLVCRAMHELLVESGAYSNKQIRDKVIEMDMSDGVKDGRSLPPPKKCPKCDAMICRKFNRCLFCGHEDRDGSPFHPTE